MRIFVILVLVEVFLTACDSNSKYTAKQSSSTDVALSLPVSSVAPMQSKPKVSENKAMLALDGFEGFNWGMSKSSTSSLAKSYGQTSNEPPEIKVKVRGYSEWFGLHFSGGKLVSVMKRYNLKNGGSEKEIKKIQAKYGDPATVEDIENEKIYTWIGKHTKIVASYQPATEYYVNIEYTPLTTIDAGISASRKQEIWNYYTNFEDKYGMDKAEEMTANKFRISKDDVLNIKVEGGKGGWSLPGEDKDLTKNHKEEERQKASTDKTQNISSEKEFKSRVVQVMNADGYTFIETVNSKGEKIWLAIIEKVVVKGDKIEYPDLPAITNYHNRTLNLTFKKITFMPDLKVVK